MLQYKACLLLFITCFIISGCADDSLQRKFNYIIDVVHTGDVNLLFNELDSESHQYFNDLRASAKSRDSLEAENLGVRNGVPISTLILYDLLVDRSSDQDNVSEEIASYSESMLKWALQLNSFGIFRSTVENPIRIREVKYQRASTAEILVSVPTGNRAIIGTTYRFNKENELWKLNFMSSMSLVEKIHNQGYRRSGLTQLEYAKQVNRSVDSNLEFRYMQTN